jgi:hypothetical protein
MSDTPPATLEAALARIQVLENELRHREGALDALWVETDSLGDENETLLAQNATLLAQNTVAMATTTRIQVLENELRDRNNAFETLTDDVTNAVNQLRDSEHAIANSYLNSDPIAPPRPMDTMTLYTAWEQIDSAINTLCAAAGIENQSPPTSPPPISPPPE